MIEYLLADRQQLFTPFVFFITGVFYGVLSAVVAIAIFPDQASIAHVLLASIAVAPIIFRAIAIGAHVLDTDPHLVLPVQSWLTGLYFSYFLGAIIGFQLSYVFAPDMYKHILISEQLEELKIIEGIKVKLSGMAVKEAFFWKILTNNLRVYVISVLLSFLYGTGGVLLLNWNASIIAALLFTKFQSNLINEAATSILAILPHSILEFLGYFMGGISGVLIGVAVIQEGWNVRLLRDTMILLAMGFLFIILGAIIESGLI